MESGLSLRPRAARREPALSGAPTGTLTTVTRHRFAGVVVVLAALAGCGGDDGSTDPTSTGPTSTSVASTGAAAAGDAWCPAARAVREAGSALDLIDASAPAQVEAAVGQLVDRLAEAEAIAPDEIAGAVAVTADSAREFRDVLAAVGYEIVRADLSSILGPENDTASRAIDAYNVEVCGFASTLQDDADADDSGPDSGVVFDPADGPIRDQAIALLVEQGFSEEQAACLFDALDLNDAAALSDPSVEAELFERCDIDPSQLPEADG